MRSTCHSTVLLKIYRVCNNSVETHYKLLLRLGKICLIYYINISFQEPLVPSKQHFSLHLCMQYMGNQTQKQRASNTNTARKNRQDLSLSTIHSKIAPA